VAPGNARRGAVLWHRRARRLSFGGIFSTMGCESGKKDTDLAVHAMASDMSALLSKSIGFESVSGNEGEFTCFIHDWAKRRGFSVDMWETHDVHLGHYGLQFGHHIPLKGRPTLLIRLPARGKAKSLIFNAHSDVVSAGRQEDWTVDPWSGSQARGNVYGRGTCDAKGSLIGALWAMAAIRQCFPDGLEGDVMLELVPGEEDAVGLGTLTSILRGYKADAVIILEPTENLPRCASRSGVRFEIVCGGRAVHGTVKWLGKDAISAMRKVLDALDTIERQWNDKNADGFFVDFPITRPVTVDFIQGGQWQGMIADSCRCRGYLELLPDDSLEEWKAEFVKQLQDIAGSDAAVIFGEEYRGHKTSPQEPLCVAAESVIKSICQWPGWSAFNSGCEAGVRANLHHTPTLIWGPGSLEHAHAADEFICFEDVEVFAKMLTELMVNWSQGSKG
jgi:acetylornithine deacetylase